MPETLVSKEQQERYDRVAGVLLGTALGDALGLPMEGMGAAAIARDYTALDRFSLFGRRGFISDDTEQSALIAQSLARHPRDRALSVRHFRRALLGWFLRLPWGIGWGTLRGCTRIALGFRKSGVSSAGNGAAMRAAIVGAFFVNDPAARKAWSRELAQVTHTDQRAVEGAHFVAELAAHCCMGRADASLDGYVERACSVIENEELQRVLAKARQLAAEGAATGSAAQELGTTGFVLHTVAIATFCFLRFGKDPLQALGETIRAGGDTDSNAAIVGAWVGALHGERKLPTELVSNLHDRDWFTSKRTQTLAGPTHLRALALDLVHAFRVFLRR